MKFLCRVSIKRLKCKTKQNSIIVLVIINSAEANKNKNIVILKSFTWSIRSSNLARQTSSWCGIGGGSVSLGLLGRLIDAVAASQA